MSLELANTLYNHIGRIKHLRTYEFLKAIEENQGVDQWSRISYAEWRDKYGIHAFILNECVRECLELQLIEVSREAKSGMVAEGGKGTKRIYRLTIKNTEPKSTPEIIQKQEITDQKGSMYSKESEPSTKNPGSELKIAEKSKIAASSTKKVKKAS